MAPDTIRLILLLLGVLLVVGIYLWDRFKRRPPRPRRVRRSAPSLPAGAVHGTAEAGAEPADETVWQDRAAGVASAARAAAVDPEPADIGDWSVPASDSDPQVAMDLHFDAHGDSDYLSTDPALYEEVERKIVVINVVARDAEFSGAAIERACAANQLRLGDMSIYHRHDGASGKVLFSVASMVEPGVFPGDAMATFHTPGLSLFTQLPGARDGVEIYTQMLDVATRLAELLHGEMRDERHNKLTLQMQTHTREAIVEHRRRVQLARSRH